MNYSSALTKVCNAALLLAFSTNTLASTWNFISMGNYDESLYFFDADTVDKSSDRNIIIWVKSVSINKPNRDGSWATAIRWKINCTKNTTQLLAWSDYGNDGKFLKSGHTPGAATEVAPDSMGEEMLKIMCEPNFPKDTSGKKYSKVPSNDIFQATKNYNESVNSKIDNAPN